MSWLATWFIFELIWVGAALDLSEPQAFKNVSLQMMIDQTIIFFRRTFFKKLHLIQFFTFDINGQSGSHTLLPLPQKFAASTTSTSTIHIPGSKLMIQISHLKYNIFVPFKFFYKPEET